MAASFDRASLCIAFQKLRDALGHVDQLGQAAFSADLDGVVSEADAADQDAEESLNALGSAGTWTRAEPLLSAMDASAQSLRQAANLMKEGALMGDNDTMGEGIGKYRESLRAFDTAITELEALDRYDFTCANA